MEFGEKKQHVESEGWNMSQLILDTKSLYNDLARYDVEFGDVFISDEAVIGAAKNSEKEMKVLKGYLSLILKTNIVSDYTKTFIRSRYQGSIRKIVSEIIENQKRDGNTKVYSKNTFLSMLQYDRDKLGELFSDDMIEQIRKHTYKNIDLYERDLNRASAKFRKESELEKLLISKVELGEITSEITDNEFNVLLDLIRPYSRKSFEQVMEHMPVGLKGYLNYMLFVIEPKDAEDIHIKRYNQLKEVLKNGFADKDINNYKFNLAETVEMARESLKSSSDFEKFQSPKVKKTSSDEDSENRRLRKRIEELTKQNQRLVEELARRNPHNAGVVAEEVYEDEAKAGYKMKKVKWDF